MRLFINTPLQLHTTLTINGAPFNHAVRVMRRKEGDALTLFNGRGGEYEVLIQTIAKKEMTVQVVSFSNIDRESSLKIHLIQAISKGERMDFTIQKAVELGVTAITPLISERSVVALNEERSEKRILHWQGVIESACEQSGRNICPTLAPTISSKTITPNLLSIPYLLFDPNAAKTLGQLLHSCPLPIKEIGLIIGPEGGFSTREFEYFSTIPSVQPISLGIRILRTETAALSILGALHALIGDWQ